MSEESAEQAIDLVQTHSKAAFGNRHFITVVKAVAACKGVPSVRSIASETKLADSVVKPILDRLEYLGALELDPTETRTRQFNINESRFRSHLEHATKVEEYALEILLARVEVITGMVQDRLGPDVARMFRASIQRLEPSDRHAGVQQLIADYFGIEADRALEHLQKMGSHVGDLRA